MKRYSAPGGYREVLKVGLPLVASMGSLTLMQFTDRAFLSGYSLDAISAAVPSGITSFLFGSFFMGTASYVTVFVAQYVGACREERVGASLWQGIYFAIMAAAILALCSLAAEPLFSAFGHAPNILALEVDYFSILCLGSGFVVLEVTLSCFFTGRGLTRTVMLVNLVGAVVNIPLDYALINGVWGFPEMGIRGAALATVSAWAFISLSYAALIFGSGGYESRYKVRSARRFDRELFSRLMRFGLPGGVQFFVEVFGYSMFTLMVGWLPESDMAANNIVFSISTLEFLPMVGLSVAVSALVGQNLGRNDPDRAAYVVGSTLRLCFLYIALVSLIFLFAPHWLLELFRPRQDGAAYAAVVDQGVVLLRILVVFGLFDAVNITLSGALRGAGDSRFLMWAMGLVSVFAMVLPVFVALKYFGWGLVAAWWLVVIYVVSLAAIFWIRFTRGAWRTMRVIEQGPECAEEAAGEPGPGKGA